MNNQPKVTFGIVNCNRLHYFKSCLESLLDCTKDYKNKEIIIIDNASVETGTEEYLNEKEKQGFTVIRNKNRDPSNEFARALNTIFEKSTGDYICPLQGDIQFILKNNWLTKYITFFEKYKKNIGCMMLDAQRMKRHIDHSPYRIFDDSMINEEFKFFIDVKRPPVNGAADVIYSRDIVEKIYPWEIKNKSHEGGLDSETKMLMKVKNLIESGDLNHVFNVIPHIPVAAAIVTDSRGTNARVRDNRRYGDYWAPKDDYRYYKIHEYEDSVEKYKNYHDFVSIEKIVEPIGFKKPIDSDGNWKKNPIRPETATEDDYVVIDKSINIDKSIDTSVQDDSHIKEWLAE
jgi:glycosyltransferase involved in cell wall biosynthesis